jgi:hypothetical protein
MVLYLHSPITLVVTKPEKCQLIQPPTTIMGTMLVMFVLSMSVIMLGSVIGLGGAVVFLLPTYAKTERKKTFLKDILKNPCPQT